MQKKYQVTWLGPPKNARIAFEQFNSVSQLFTIQLILEDDSWLNQISIKWSLEGTNQ